LTELLVHALAQLPDDVSLRLPAPPPALARLARAYGIADRLREGDGPPAFLRGGSEIDAAPAGGLGELVDRIDPDAGGHSVPRGDDTVFAGRRIAILTNFPAPYRHGLFERLHGRITSAGGAMRVFFASPGRTDRPWMSAEGLAYDHSVLRSFRLPFPAHGPPVPLDLERHVLAYAPHVVINGGMSPLTAPRVVAVARRLRAPLGIWSGELPGSPSTRGRRAFRRWVMSNARFALAYGSGALAYLREIYDGPVVIARNSAALAPPGGPRPAPRDRLELVTVGDLNTPRKGIDVLINALAADPGLRCRLTVVGGGALEGELRARAAEDDRIVFTGPVPNARVREILADADLYLTPVREEPFGLALLEAMGAGLAVVSSSAPGLLADLGIHERTCLVVPGHDPQAWAGEIRGLAGDSALRERIGAHAARVVRARWTLDHAADAMIAGVRIGLEARAG
jgi:glycosyltransferase involved in cell wall biosynthesis